MRAQTVQALVATLFLLSDTSALAASEPDVDGHNCDEFAWVRKTSCSAWKEHSATHPGWVKMGPEDRKSPLLVAKPRRKDSGNRHLQDHRADEFAHRWG